jgi:F-type H+-transporting ATPase subunit b
LKYSTPHSRFSFHFFRFAFLALLAAGMTVAPFQVVAQQPASASRPAQTSAAAETSASGSAQPKEAKKSEQEEIDGYLHAPVVQTIARVLHLDVVTTARIFEGINFAIIFLAIAIPLFRVLPKIIRKRSETLRSSIESARKVTEDANTRLSAVEARLSRLDEEIAKFRTEVEAEMGQDEARIKASLAEESTRIVASAEQEIAVAAAQARRGLRHFAADLAVGQAAKQLVLSPENDRALIAEFVAGAGRNGTTSGGQN